MSTLIKKNKYRFDVACGKLYEYDADARAYIFVSSTQYKTKKAAVAEYEKYSNHQ